MSEVRKTGTLGTYFLEATTAHANKKFSMLLINTDAVFTALTITNQDSSIPASNGLATQNLVARTVSQGSTITAPYGSWFSAVTMSSGSAIGIISE